MLCVCTQLIYSSVNQIPHENAVSRTINSILIPTINILLLSLCFASVVGRAVLNPSLSSPLQLILYSANHSMVGIRINEPHNSFHLIP